MSRRSNEVSAHKRETTMSANSPLRLTDRDEQILDMLALRVRAATRNQIARTWWSDTDVGRSTAKRRLKRLVTQGLVTTLRSTVINLPPLYVPLVVWNLVDPLPDFGQLAWKLAMRWKTPTRSAVIYVATKSGSQLFGGRRRGRLARPFQLSHDLGVTEMYLGVLRRQPADVRSWIDEERLAPYRRRQKLPDAVLADSVSSTPRLVLEFGGVYGKRRLEHFHADAENRGCPYEIW